MTTYIKDYTTNSGAQLEITGILRKETIKFPAFLTSLTDNMTSQWNEETVYGRPDPIGTFQNTTRKISIGFDLPAADITEAKENLYRINTVKQFLYPAYSSIQSEVTPVGSASTTMVTTNALSLAKSPVVRLKFANLIQNNAGAGLLGWIGSFSATPVIDMGMFNESQQFFPKVYNVSVDFTPQHEFDLGYDSDGFTLDGKFPDFPYTGGSKPK